MHGQLLQLKQPRVSCEFGPIHLLRSDAPKLKGGRKGSEGDRKGREVREREKKTEEGRGQRAREGGDDGQSI